MIEFILHLGDSAMAKEFMRIWLEENLLKRGTLLELWFMSYSKVKEEWFVMECESRNFYLYE